MQQEDVLSTVRGVNQSHQNYYGHLVRRRIVKEGCNEHRLATVLNFEEKMERYGGDTKGIQTYIHTYITYNLVT